MPENTRCCNAELGQNRQDSAQVTRQFSPVGSNALEPFDLARAKAGDPVVAADGSPVRIIATDIKSRHPVVAAVSLGDCEAVETYTKKGEACYYRGPLWNLYMAPKPQVTRQFSPVMLDDKAFITTLVVAAREHVWRQCTHDAVVAILREIGEVGYRIEPDVLPEQAASTPQEIEAAIAVCDWLDRYNLAVVSRKALGCDKPQRLEHEKQIITEVVRDWLVRENISIVSNAELARLRQNAMQWIDGHPPVDDAEYLIVAEYSDSTRYVELIVSDLQWAECGKSLNEVKVLCHMRAPELPDTKE